MNQGRCDRLRGTWSSRRGHHGGDHRGAGGSHRGRHPPWLKGKEIGLFYARRNIAKREEATRPVVSLDSRQKHSIRKLLENFQLDDLRRRSSQHEGHHHFMSRYTKHLVANSRGPKFLIDLKINLARDVDSETVFKDQLQRKEHTPEYQRMLQFRKTLPAFEKKDVLVDLIKSNPVVVISGETGCGKTTQVPQFILDAAIKESQGSITRIVCTQPRRISAISVAERVAEERADSCGGENSSVGYQIRLESRLPRDAASILFCTTGVVLQWMKSNPTLEGISHIVLDEIHERDILSDFLMTCLRDLLSQRRTNPLKVILMSATLNAREFSKYFFKCPTINIPGFTHPVKEYYLEDVLEMTNFRFESKSSGRKSTTGPKWQKFTKRGKEEKSKIADYEEYIGPFLRDLRSQGRYSESTLRSLECPESEEINLELISSLIAFIHRNHDEGAILVFLPGWTDISKLHKLLTEDSRHRLDPARTRIYPLHSLMPTINQRAIFEKPPSGVRKIVIATNIAETSITIEDIVYVIDCGKIKLTNYDVNLNVATLKPEWVSLANARQRRGRAGRVRPGICYHLFTKAREMTLDQFIVPEILRTRLEEVILHIKSLGLGLAKPFLAKVLNPPEENSVDLALSLLRTIGALHLSREDLTPLGFHLSGLPMDPQTGKMILLGAMFSCLDPILTIASALNFKDPFVIPLGSEAQADRRRRELAGNSKSDHLMLANAFQGWQSALQDGNARSYCWDNFLSESTLKMLKNMKRQFAETLYDMRFIDSKDENADQSNLNSNNEALVRAVICAGLYPNVAKINVKYNRRRGEFVTLASRTEHRVSMHPKSVNEKETRFKYPWMVYHQMMKSSGTFIYDGSMVSPLALIFFGKSVTWDYHDSRSGVEVIQVDDFVKFNCDSGVGQLVQDLRNALDTLLEHKITHPSSSDWRLGSKEGDLLRAIVELLTVELEGLEPNVEAEGDEEET